MAKPSLIRTPTWPAILEAVKNDCGFVMLGHGRFSLLDEWDMVEQEGFKWRITSNGYAKRDGGTNGRQGILLHRVVTRAAPGFDVDHKNRNKLDNRSKNLRLCTTVQNAGNSVSSRKNKTSIYKGVCCKRSGIKKWLARGKIDYKNVFIGGFNTEVEAAEAYNQWALKVFGEFACLNEIP